MRLDASIQQLDPAKTLPLEGLFALHAEDTKLVEAEAGDGFEADADLAIERLSTIEEMILRRPARTPGQAAGKIGIALQRAVLASDGELDPDWLLVQSAFKDLTAQEARAKDALFAAAGAPALMPLDA